MFYQEPRKIGVYGTTLSQTDLLALEALSLSCHAAAADLMETLASSSSSSGSGVLFDNLGCSSSVMTTASDQFFLVLELARSCSSLALLCLSDSWAFSSAQKKATSSQALAPEARTSFQFFLGRRLASSCSSLALCSLVDSALSWASVSSHRLWAMVVALSWAISSNSLALCSLCLWAKSFSGSSVGSPLDLKN